MLTCHPGAIFGPGLVTQRALHRTSFNRVLLAAIRGNHRPTSPSRSPGSPRDVAAGSIAALDRGMPGSRYWLMGRPEDEISTAAGCNRACEIAGVEHRVEDLDHRTAPKEILDMFGPTLLRHRRGRRQRGPTRHGRPTTPPTTTSATTR